jgi:hypothetical protein
MSQNNLRQGVKCLVFSILGMLCSLDFITTRYGLSKEGFPSPFVIRFQLFILRAKSLGGFLNQGYRCLVSHQLSSAGPSGHVSVYYCHIVSQMEALAARNTWKISAHD